MIVGFAGHAFTGKDTCADYLVSRGTHSKAGTSDPLDRMLKVLDPKVLGSNRYSRVRELSGDYSTAKKIREVRELLQRQGDAVREQFGETAIIERAIAMAADKDPDAFPAITGLRYPYEVDWIRKLGGKTFWVHRPGYEAVNKHKVENSLPPGYCDGVINNDGTLEDLHRKLGDLIP